jgi:hypothetical protein
MSLPPIQIMTTPTTPMITVLPEVVAAVEEAKAAHSRLFIGAFGDGTTDKEIDESIGKDLERAGLLSIPVTIAILIVAFGALVAALDAGQVDRPLRHPRAAGDAPRAGRPPAEGGGRRQPHRRRDAAGGPEPRAALLFVILP